MGAKGVETIGCGEAGAHNDTVAFPGKAHFGVAARTIQIGL